MNEQSVRGPSIFFGNQNVRSPEFPHMIYHGTSVSLHNSDSPSYSPNHGGSIFRSRKHRVVSGGFREQRRGASRLRLRRLPKHRTRCNSSLLAREIRRSWGRARMIHSCHRTAASRNSKVSRSERRMFARLSHAREK